MTARTIDDSEREAAGITYLTRNAAALFGDLRVALRSLGRSSTRSETYSIGFRRDSTEFSARVLGTSESVRKPALVLALALTLA